MFTDSKRSELNHALWIVTQARSGSIGLAYGNPGLAKTDICKLFADSLGVDYWQFILSQQMPEDAGGIPTPGEVVLPDNLGTHKCVTPRLNETVIRAMHTECVVHLDEVNQCRPATMAANQELWFNNPPAKSMVIATANDIEIATDAFQFSAPMINRMCVLDWEFDQSSWQAGMANGGQFQMPEFPVLRGDWSGYKTKWMGLVGQFSQVKPQHFDWKTVFPKTDEERALPWRSPRSWTRGSICLGAAEAVGASRTTAMKILKGFIGEGPALEFFNWIDQEGFPPAHVMLDDPSRLFLPPRFDTAASIVSGVHCLAKRRIEESLSDDLTHETFEKGLDFCEAVFSLNREVGSAVVGKFVKLKPANYQPKRRSHQLWDTINMTRTLGA